MPQCSRRVNQSAAGRAGVFAILLTGETMKSFLERLALLSGKLRIHLVSFISSDIGTERSVHESLTLQGWRPATSSPRLARGLSHSASSSWPRGLPKGMQSPASLKRDINKSVKKQAREPWNERKRFTVCAHFN
jgi:hypothetical protein